MLNFPFFAIFRVIYLIFYFFIFLSFVKTTHFLPFFALFSTLAYFLNSLFLAIFLQKANKNANNYSFFTDFYPGFTPK